MHAQYYRQEITLPKEIYFLKEKKIIEVLEKGIRSEFCT